MSSKLFKLAGTRRCEEKEDQRSCASQLAQEAGSCYTGTRLVPRRKREEMAEQVSITSVKVEYSLDSTIEVRTSDGRTSWVKPGAKAGFSFNGIPDPETLKLASSYAFENVLADAIQETTRLLMEKQ